MPRSANDSIPSGIRGHYERHGSDGFYRRFGRDYSNPHEQIVRASILSVVARWKPDLSHVLDLAAGSGEATLALLDAGAGRIDGIDPYTFEAYKRRTGREAGQLTFEQIAAGALAGRSFSLIVCSFALHLCERPRLAGLMCQLALAAPSLLVLTPHKRPSIRPEWGWVLCDESLTDRVRTRMYHAKNYFDITVGAAR